MTLPTLPLLPCLSLLVGPLVVIHIPPSLHTSGSSLVLVSCLFVVLEAEACLYLSILVLGMDSGSVYFTQVSMIIAMRDEPVL